jgi:hypothetical protein
MSLANIDWDSNGSDAAPVHLDDDLEKRAQWAREMVHDLERFLGAALARTDGDYTPSPWPLRYNSVVRSNSCGRFGVE